MSPHALHRRWFPRLTPTVRAILVVTVAVHVVLMLLRAAGYAEVHQAVLSWTELVPTLALERPWTLLTMALIHDPRDLFHILFNMLALYSLGPWVEQALGPRRFLTTYGVSALAGSLLFVGTGFLLGDPRIGAIGASGAVLGILTAFALLFPDAELRIWFTAPIRARNLVWLAIGIDLILTLFGSNIAVAVHMGGMLGAWLYLRRPWRRAYLRKQRLILEMKLRRLR